MSDDAFRKLCDAYGLEPGYRDIHGEWREADAEVQRALLAAMRVDASRPDEALAALEAERWSRIVEPAVVRRAPRLDPVRLQIPDRLRARELRWRILEENGASRQGRFTPEALEANGESGPHGVRAYGLPLPSALGPGYHSLSILDGADVLAESLLIVAPERAHAPAPGTRFWGCTLQLYGITSERSAGIGDFGDLREAAQAWGRRGASFLGTNPLHALEDPRDSSPYRPSSRLFVNTLYVDVTAIPDFAELASREPAMASQWSETSARLRETELVDYAAVAPAKRAMLERLHAHFLANHRGRDTDRWRAFERFRAARGEALRRHAVHEALRDAQGCAWPQWPAELRDPSSAAVVEFARANEDAVSFHAWLQWQADQQLARVQAQCRATMPVGLYADLAVSISPDGSDAWARQDAYAREVSVGAPPDPFNEDGQSWGLPPLIPAALRAQAYAPFIEIVRANMAHAGALRIDHVMGLERLYWVPPGVSPKNGAYVRYPFEDLIAIVALESARHRTIVVGEDLGTVPDGMRERLQDAGVLSYRILLFERDGEQFRDASSYPPLALAAWSTHDLPTLAGWWKLATARERALLLGALEKDGFAHPAATASAGAVPERVALDLHEFLARTPSALMAVQMEDVLGALEQANLPGTTDGPNWRRKLSVPVETWGAHARVKRFAARLVKARGAPLAPRPLPERVPRATYRIQLNARFGFRDAEAIVPYLDLLGVSHLYCSPCLRAREGSSHGYDIVDHDALNPELGTREEFESLVRALKSRGMGILLDIVPNHMGVLAADNARWLDVLENGPASRSARFFDIDWEPPAAHLAGRVLLPVLGATYGTALESGDMKLAFDAERGAFAVQYFEHRLPIDPRCYPEILERAGLSDLAGDFASLPARDAPEESALDERAERVPLLQARLRDAARDAAVTARLQEAIETYHGTPGVAASFDALHALLERQAYRPAYWGVAQDELNYRRFFDVNDLAALRQEDALVFDETHRFVASLVRDGSVDGLRIDHPDGLFDPKGYFERLQDACGKPTYVVVEKILATHEGLRETWAVHGTTGYDFANLVNGLFVDPRAEARITRAYALFTGDGGTFEESARLARRQVLAGALGAELRVLANRLARIALADRRYRDFTLETLRTALAEVLAAFPIYRTYIDDEAREQDLVAIERALAVARSARKASDPGVFDFIQDALSAQLPAGTPAAAAAIRQFSRKFQQLSAPVMAKGVEDTAFYRFNRLVSLNDVGGDPARFGTTPSAFHRDALDRARAWPHSLLATSTHDNKRSEDVRARIDAISEMAGAWRLALRRWHDWNAAKRTRLGDAWAPSLDDEYLLYQTLLGSFPQEQGADLDAYAERIVTYMRKAQREAKRHTSWTRVDEAYEAATEGFVRAILANGPANRFLDDLRAALAQVAWLGALNSLSLLTLKLTAPGVPDIYQGNELFDFSLVDPDNRRPVDFARRAQLLDTFRDEVDAAAIFREMGDRAKLLVCARLLGLRRTREALFREGRYVPLRVSGARARHVVAFMRRSGRDALVVVAPRLFGGLGVAPGVLPCGEAVWGDTAIEAPPLEASVADLFTSRVHAPAAHYRLAELLAVSPVAVLATIPGV